jgi:hypothetical protein
MIGCGKKKLIFFKFLNDLSTYGFHTRAVPCRTAPHPIRTAPHRATDFQNLLILSFSRNFALIEIDEIEILANFFRIF